MGSFVVHSGQAKNVISNDTEYNIVDILENSEQEQYIVNEIPSKPTYNISLAQEYQDLIYNLCEINDLSYELVLAIFYHESKFNIYGINKNKDGSSDRGISMINSKYIDTYKEFAIKYCDFPKNKELDVFNPEDSIRAGIGGLVYYKKYFQDKKISNKYFVPYILGYYNMGISGYEEYIRKNGIKNRKYDKVIIELKNKLEQTGNFI